MKLINFRAKMFLTAAAILLTMAWTAFASDMTEAPNILFEIEVPMVVGAQVTVLHDGHKIETGRVNALPTKTRYPSYTASAWGKNGEVCATAVNAIHMLVSVENNKGRTMSIIPQQTIAPAAGAGASIVISSKAGEGIFGAWAPTAGSEIFVKKANTETVSQLSQEVLPKAGDTVIIKVYSKKLPYMVEIENRPGGRVTVWDENGYRVAARVIRPVGGTGRFEGTLFQRSGAIRANHSGVIDVSTSARGSIGGFQIIPWDHALTSKEMQGAWNMSQWMIIAPADGESKLGATFPLFKGALVSGTADGETLWDVWSTYGRKSLILARFDGSEWKKLPNLAGKSDSALKDVTHIRIYYPFTEEPQIDFK